MLRISLAAAALLLLAFWVTPAPRSEARDDRPAGRQDADFLKKYVAVNFKLAGHHTAAILQEVGVRRLGTREFLVGEIVAPEGMEAEDWKGSIQWIPVECIDSLLVFDDKAKALRVADAARKGAEKK